MVGNTGKLTIQIEVDDKGTPHVKTFGREVEKAADKGEKGFKRTGKSLDDMNKRLEKSHGWILKVGGAMLTYFGARRLVSAMEEWVRLSGKQEQATAGMEQAMRSMGRYTPELYNQLIHVAQSLQKVTTFGDEATIEGQKFLLTYKDITDDLLPRTSKAMLDLAAHMKGDTTQAANMLGKASMGMTGELRRVGITVDQDTYKAKGFVGVLEQIEEQVKGQAEALRKTGYGELKGLGNLYDDVREKWGKFITDIGQMGVFEELGKQINALDEATRNWTEANKDLIAQKVPEYIEKIKNTSQTMWDIISYDPAIIEWGLVGLLIGGKKWGVLAAGVGHLSTWAKDLSRVLTAAALGIIEIDEVTNISFKDLHKLAEQLRVYMQTGAKYTGQITEGMKEEAKAAQEAAEKQKELAEAREEAAMAAEKELKTFATGFVNYVRDTSVEDWIADLEKKLAKVKTYATAFVRDIRAEEVEAEAEKNEKIYREYEHILENMHDITGSFLYDIITDQEDAWQNLFENIYNYFGQMLSQMIAKAAMEEIVVPIVFDTTGLDLNKLAGSTGTTATGGFNWQSLMSTGNIIGFFVALGSYFSHNIDREYNGVPSGGAMEGHFATDPWQAWAYSKMGLGFTAGERFDAAIAENDWTQALKELPGVLNYFSDPARAQIYDITQAAIGDWAALLDPASWFSNLFGGGGGASMDFTHMRGFGGTWIPGQGILPSTQNFNIPVPPTWMVSGHENDAVMIQISEAYRDARNTVIAAFNEEMLSLVETLGDEYGGMAEDMLKGESFYYTIDPKRFYVKDAEAELERRLGDFAEWLDEKVQKVYNAVIPQYIRGEIMTSEFYSKLGPNVQKTFQDLLGGGYDYEQAMDLMSSFKEGEAAYERLIFQMEAAAGLLSDLEIAQFGVNQQWDNWIATLRALGVSEEEVAKAEELRMMALDNLAARYAGVEQAMDTEALSETFENIRFQILSMTGQLTDMEIETYIINRQFDDWIATLTELGATQEQLTWIEQQRIEALGNLTDAVIYDVESIRQEYLRLTTSLANPADVYERLAILEGQLAPIGSALTEADLALYREYLTLAQEAYQRPSRQYQDIYQLATSAYEAWLEQHRSYQTGTPYVPVTGPAIVHQGEKITAAGETGRQGDMYISLSPTFHIDGAKDPRQTEREIEKRFIRWVQGTGGPAIKQAVKYQ